MAQPSDEALSVFDLTDYEEVALRELLSVGRTTAPNLSEATGIPKARIYGVLDSLSESGFIKVIPGRPKQYEPHPPEELVNRAIESRRQEFEEYQHRVESVREEFVDTYGPIENQSRDDLRPTEDLFHIVDVGEPSERETRRLYREADERIVILSKSFGFLDAVAPTLKEAVQRDISVQCLLLSPEFLSEENRERQAGIRFNLVVNHFVFRGLTDRPLTVYGDGSNWRPFVHVRDAARAYAHAALEPESWPKRVYNVGSNEANYRISEIAEIVREEIDRDLDVTYLEDEHPGPSYHVNFDRLAETGFEPEWTLREGVRDVAERLQQTAR